MSNYTGKAVSVEEQWIRENVVCLPQSVNELSNMLRDYAKEYTNSKQEYKCSVCGCDTLLIEDGNV